MYILTAYLDKFKNLILNGSPFSYVPDYIEYMLGILEWYWYIYWNIEILKYWTIELLNYWNIEKLN